jgi:hypothetical protein
VIFAASMELDISLRSVWATKAARKAERRVRPAARSVGPLAAPQRPDLGGHWGYPSRDATPAGL